jgi:6-pyruvoyltetrahydropterin/6-carboxytetrahydropterin synthase
MYAISKRMEIAGSHNLALSYDSKCKNCHGHNWIITIELRSEELNEEGMILDFVHIKEIVNQLDHNHINSIVDCNPTAENMAKWIADKISEKLPKNIGAWVHRVDVQESEGNTATYYQDFIDGFTQE